MGGKLEEDQMSREINYLRNHDARYIDAHRQGRSGGAFTGGEAFLHRSHRPWGWAALGLLALAIVGALLLG